MGSGLSPPLEPVVLLLILVEPHATPADAEAVFNGLPVPPETGNQPRCCMVRIFASVENVSLSGNAVRQSASRNEMCQPLRSMNCIRTRCFASSESMSYSIGEWKANKLWIADLKGVDQLITDLGVIPLFDSYLLAVRLRKQEL